MYLIITCFLLAVAFIGIFVMLPAYGLTELFPGLFPFWGYALYCTFFFGSLIYLAWKKWNNR